MRIESWALCSPSPATIVSMSTHLCATPLHHSLLPCNQKGTAKVQPGDVVVVTAAAGGTGHFAVQVSCRAGAVGGSLAAATLTLCSSTRIVGTAPSKWESGHALMFFTLCVCPLWHETVQSRQRQPHDSVACNPGLACAMAAPTLTSRSRWLLGRAWWRCAAARPRWMRCSG